MGLWILAEKSVICATALMVSAALAAPQATFYVSPSGNDAAEGTKDAPFKTITRRKKPCVP